MRELVGVRPRFGFDPSTIKRDSLFFKRIAVPQDPNLGEEIKLRIARAMGLQHDQDRSGLLYVPDWLYDEEFLFEPRLSCRREGNEEYIEQFDASVDRSNRAHENLARNEEVNRRVHWIVNLDDENQQEIERRKFFTEMEVADWAPIVRSTRQELELASEHNARAMAIKLREEVGMNTVPVLNREMSNPKGNKVTEQDVIKIVLDALPVPDDSVSWEQIREFRSDPELQEQFLALRRWMIAIAAGNYVRADAQEEMEYLMNRYRKCLKRRGLKTVGIRIAAFLKASAPFLGEKKGPIVGGFGVALRRVSLWLGEDSGSGSEIAYVLTSRDKFAR